MTKPLPPKPFDPARPLAGASRRLMPPRKRTAHLTERQVGIVHGLAGAGVPQNKIASVLSVSHNVVEQAIVGVPDAQALILEIRGKLKLAKMRKALVLEEKLWNLADTMIEREDAKGVDGTMRAIHASEKIQQAVAGESQKVEMTGRQAPVDLTVLIQQLLHA